jgi:Zn-dependent protease with chaperone function
MNIDQLSQSRQRFKGIDASAFQHPLDRDALNQLKRLKGFDIAVSKFIEFGGERFDYIINNANSIRVGPRQYKRLHNMLREACEILDMPEPALYVSHGGINAYTSGHRNPYIVLLTGLIDTMDDAEVQAVIAHELGHIKCAHVLYSMMARYLAVVIDIVSTATLGLGGLVGSGLQAGLMVWSRRSELSADRAALLVVQDPRPCISMLMKLAGHVGRMADDISVEDFLNQAREYGEESDRNATDKFYRIMSNMFLKGTHPFAIERAKHLNTWIDSPEYEQIVDKGIYRMRADLVIDNRCPNPECRREVQHGFAFCGGCGRKLAWS